MDKKGMVWYCAVASLLFITLLQLINTAWISDDAAITLRSVLNFTHGYGATFNIDERVQSYTHPLWFLILSATSFIFNNILAGTYFISIFVSFCVVCLLITRTTSHVWSGIFSVILLLLSKAYVDFSTSGLENPLSHLLIVISVLFGLSALKSHKQFDITMCALSGACLYLSRPDLILLLMPWCGLVLYKTHKQLKTTLLTLLVAFLPILLWTIFSIIYYGFPFPNTAYAKLHTNIPLGERVFHGLRYILDSWIQDPITMSGVVIALLFAIRGSLQVKALSLGILLYLFYVISIGGDFMSGRFLTPLFLTAVITITFFNFSKITISTIIFLVLLGVLNIKDTVLSNSSYENNKINKWDISDERGFYYQQYGLLSSLAKGGLWIVPQWPQQAKTEELFLAGGGLGFGSLMSGPAIHFVDVYALCDPLLARLSPIQKRFWRAGHLVRQIPIGYKESILTDSNQLHDPTLRDYYDDIREITRGPIFSLNRLKAIFRVNLTALPNFDAYAILSGNLTTSKNIKSSELSLQPTETGKPINLNSHIGFDELTVLEIKLPTLQKILEIDVSFDESNHYKIEYFNAGRFYRLTEVSPSSAITAFYNDNVFISYDTYIIKNKKMTRYVLPIEPSITTDRLRITAINGDGLSVLGHLLLN